LSSPGMGFFVRTFSTLGADFLARSSQNSHYVNLGNK
jgi:hypothetical protein